METENDKELILVKFYEDGEFLDISYFQKGTKAGALFEFIGREDIYLENVSTSLTIESGKRKLESVFPNKSHISLNVIAFDKISKDATKVDHMDMLDPIVISDSPVKDAGSITPLSTIIDDFILIPDSPVKRTPFKELTPSSSDELPIIKSKENGGMKRKRKNSDDQNDTVSKKTSRSKRILISSSSDSDDTCNTKQNKKQCKIKYDTRTLKPIPAEKLPYNINGNVAFQLQYDNNERQKMKSSQDGRLWNRYNKSFTNYFKASHGTRLRSTCKGSFKCRNSGCPYLQYYKVTNTQRVVKEGDVSKCEECDEEMEFVPCSAVKIWEFPIHKTFVNVFHFEDHSCTATDKPNPPVDKIKTMYELNSDFRPCQVSSKLIMKSVETASSRKEVEELAYSLADESAARNIKQSVKGQHEAMSKRLFDLQQKCMDTYNDPYLLYKFQMVEQDTKTCSYNVVLSELKGDKIVKSEWNSKEKDRIFVVKSSKEKLRLLSEIMKADNIMGEEYVYMDFKENRIKGKGKNIKTLGLSVYHVILKKVVWLVRMDCEKEDKDTVLLFLNSIDDMLQHHTKKTTEFRPVSGWMLDEGGGLHSALESKFGSSYCQENVVTCQLHLNMCRNRHTTALFMGDNDKERKTAELRRKISDMVHSSTVNQYLSNYNIVKNFITENGKPTLLKWLQWWDKRRNHVMDAYRNISAPTTNLAEVSHASTSHCGGSDLNLIQTAIFDISDCFKYAQAIKGYFSGIVKAGSGPSYQKKQTILEQKSKKQVESLLHELDDQFKGDKAPLLPLGSSFTAEPGSSHRADKSTEKDKRPIGKRRTNISKDFKGSIEKAKSMNGYKCVEINVHSPMQATVSLLSPQEETYLVNFGQKSSCSCLFSQIQNTERSRNIACKHRLVILMGLGYSDTGNIIKQYSYTMSEVGDIVNRLYNFSSDPTSLKLNIQSSSNKYSDLKDSFRHLTSSDPFELTYLHGIISKCYGCDEKYSEINRKPPFDVIIKHLEIRPRYNNEKKEWFIPANKTKSNAYYHLQTDCVQKVHPNFKAKDIEITKDFLQTLSEEHKSYLTNLGIDF